LVGDTATDAGADINHPEDPLLDIYNAKIDKLDETTVKDWGRDMDGILIFVSIPFPLRRNVFG
jgi:hypothetical protein